ncbi:MAG TPA: hypothetical protein VKA18_08680 [Alphaproteobacteria bacterium]|nr:hypothetical protein [Alphaproteobacteria bacterium]
MTSPFINPHPITTTVSGLTVPLSLTYDEWCATYVPLKNSLCENAPFDGTMFETFGDEMAFVRQQPCNRIWTLVQGDDGDLYVISGYHFVNRLGYFVTDRPLPENESVEIAVD